MAKRTSLREFQQYLNDRLSSNAQGEHGSSMLGVETGGKLWLLDLSDSGEIIPPPALISVPLTHPFFLGLTNIRGNLYAVTDFALFTGEAPVPLNAPSTRLLLVGIRQNSNVALLVHRILGLRKLENFTEADLPYDAPAWNTGLFIDVNGQEWRRVDLKILLSDPTFMNIAA